MPTSLNGYQRAIVKGVPVWKKGDALYLYDMDVGSHPINIGTASEGFSVTWVADCSAKLATYRAEAVSRVRRANATPSKKK